MALGAHNVPVVLDCEIVAQRQFGEGINLRRARGEVSPKLRQMGQQFALEAHEVLNILLFDVFAGQQFPAQAPHGVVHALMGCVEMCEAIGVNPLKMVLGLCQPMPQPATTVGVRSQDIVARSLLQERATQYAPRPFHVRPHNAIQAFEEFLIDCDH
jgi:hypothetical protein